ncbi:Wzz/FepE/Etk N-terminal domain-containing protein [Candidatus Pelagibacter sp. HIMB1709]|uniref:Wzz/FepE/Etk N-terminal domain-containing protein n=1 Tax=Candidatus Pelagibacter sp. HIMB1709 TaxID=3413367 RepID=UPI003F8281C1
MKKKPFNDEINLADLIFYLWNNKIKIIIITTTFIFLGFFYFTSLEKKFLAKTDIKPISTFESQKYRLFNSLAGKEIININPTILFNLFLNKIQTTEIIEEAISKFNLVNKDKFQNQKIYEEEIQKTAILIIDSMLPPSNDEENESKKILNWQFNFEIYDKTNWRNFLEYLEKRANEEIRITLINRFNTEIEILETNSKFNIEDIEQSIANALDDYKTSIINRLAFLEEQAEIARTLNIAKNTLEAENFQTNNAIVTNIKSENSYYLKGYEMIEKEISLINSRENEKAFISNILELEKNKRSILQNKSIERIKLLFLETPINNTNNFKAAKIEYIATIYDQQVSLSKILVISAIAGLLISIIYIFTKSIIASRK